ncbi:MAG: nucleotidyltransferase family protein [Thermoleophilia bacterium]|nr:nucleotidyltransferase family protein [Thermoleophilia bacterium]
MDPVERSLLVAASRLNADSARMQRVQKLAQRDLNWEALVNQSTIHGTAGIIYRNLTASGHSVDIPEAELERLKKIYLMTAAMGLRHLTQLREIAQELTSQGIEIIVLKGAVLAERIYGDVGLRPFSDVDILVREEDWPRIYEVLKKKGCQPPPGKDFREVPPKLMKYDVMSHMQWTSPLGTCLEFQFDLLTMGVGMRDIGGVWDRSRKAEILGSEVRVLGPEDQLLHLVIHANRHGCARLKWLSDISESLYQNGHDWDLLVRIAQREGIAACFHATIAHIQRLYDTRLVPEEVMRRIKPRFYKEAVWNRIWPQEQLGEFQGRHEDAICFYFYRPLSGWNLLNFVLTGRVRDKLVYQLRWIFPSLKWMSVTYGKPRSLALLKYYLWRLAGFAVKRDKH